MFTGGPILASLAFSFTNWTGLTTQEWVGLQNFRQLLFDDKLFWIATRNTFFYSFGSVILGTLGALFVAILMNQKLPGTTLLRVIYYLPSIASGVAGVDSVDLAVQPTGRDWSTTLSLIGIEGPLWLGSQQWALPALIIKSTWAIGANMIILLAGLQAIPHSLYEAAKIDGANPWHEFRNVTIPMLSPVLFYVIDHINHQLVPDSDRCLGHDTGGPGTSTYVYVYYHLPERLPILEDGIRLGAGVDPFHHYPGLTLLQLWGSRKWVYYEDEGR